MTTGYHEPVPELSPAIRAQHQALASLIEELEAVDWYNQRAGATSDAELREILLHHRNEEIEHAGMLLEWLRRQMPEMDKELRDYLFKAGSIIAAEHAATGKNGGTGDDTTDLPVNTSAGTLNIGKFQKGE